MILSMQMNAATLFKVKEKSDHSFAKFMQVTEVKLNLEPV